MTTPLTADADDVRLALDGDREAFGRLFDRHARSVRAVVAAVSCDFPAVEDLTQETFLRAYKSLPNLKDRSAFRGWIHGIARTVAKEGNRRRSRDLRMVESTATQLADNTKTCEVNQRREEQRIVLGLLLELPERERLAVHAYFFQEQRVDEAAESMGISRSGFYAALDRGLNRIRSRLTAIEAGAGNVRQST